MGRKHRPYGKGEASEEYGRDKSPRAKARKHRIRHNIKKMLREDEALNNARIHYELLNAFRL